MSNDNEQPDISEDHEVEAVRPSGGKFTWLLWTGAVATLLLASVLPFADRLSWRLMQVGNVLASVGLLPGVLFLAGLTFAALAIVSHAIASASRSNHSVSERFETACDELMTQMALVRSGQNNNQNTNEELRQVLSRVGAEVASLGSKEGEASSDALFRLAASVDQLNARMDERFNSVMDRVEERMDEIRREFERHNLPSVAAGYGSAPLPKAAFEPDPVDELLGTSPQENPFAKVDLEEEPAMEFLDSMEEQVEGRAHKPSKLSLDLDDSGLGGPFAIEVEDSITFDKEDLPPSIGDSRRSA